MRLSHWSHVLEDTRSLSSRMILLTHRWYNENAILLSPVIRRCTGERQFIFPKIGIISDTGVEILKNAGQLVNGQKREQ